MKGKIITISILSVLILGIVAGIIGIAIVTGDAELDKEKLNVNSENLYIYDNNLNVISSKDNSYVSIDDISPFIKDAFIALEDKRFYKHSGIDYRRLAGALWNNIKSMSFKEGASTISQQLIKNTHLTNEKKISRKLKEAKITRQLEKNYTKNEILEMYLNVIYFGSGIYGVKNASLAFFGKLPSEVNLAEACIIAGVVKNPRAYSPILNIENAHLRKETVLSVLKKQGKINENFYNSEKNRIIILKNSLINNNYNKSYSTNVINEASQILNMDEKDLINSGYKIYTYLNDNEQKYAQKLALNKDLSHNMPTTIINIDNNTLGITSYFSTVNKADEYIQRQVGSTIKPLAVYSPALELNKIMSASQINDEKININGYSPNNYNGVFHGYVSVRDSVAHSYNVPAVKILNDIGIDISKEFLSRIGINLNDKDCNLSLALGSVSMSPLQLVSGYTMLANGGQFSKPTFIKEIRDSHNNLLYTNSTEYTKVMSEENAYIMTDMLKSVVKYGTAKKLDYLNYDMAAKTGTVSVGGSKNTDAWCVAYTPVYTHLVWQGSVNNDEENLLSHDISGGTYPAMILRNMADNIYVTPPPQFQVPERIVSVDIDYDELINNHKVIIHKKDGRAIREIFNKDFMPDGYSENKELSISVENKNGNIYIAFEGINGVEYKLYKKSLLGKYKEINTIICNGSKVVFIDTKPGIFDSGYLIKYNDMEIVIKN